MKRNRAVFPSILIAVAVAGGGALLSHAVSPKKVVSSYGPINQEATFSEIKAARMAVKVERSQAHAELLSSRYDLNE
jgi:hypothetical protein